MVSYISKMIHHCGTSLSKQCIPDLMFVLAHKPCTTEGFVTVCCSMSVTSKTSCSQAVQFSPGIDIMKLFLQSRLLLRLHTFGLNLILGTSKISGAYECQSTSPEATQPQHVICIVSEQPTLVCRGPQLPCTG